MRTDRVWCATVLLLGCVLSLGTSGALGEKSAGESLRIGPGDLLSVSVFREPELAAKVRVKDAGTAQLPLLGDVPVSGLPAADAGDRIAALYASRGILRHPQVSVFVEESATEQVAVLGEVQRPGTMALTAPRTLLDVLAEAGGLTKFADRRITIRRPHQEPISVTLANDAQRDLEEADVLIQPGDTVLVPRAGIVYVLGDVGRPGGFVMQDDAHISLLQAMALAAAASKTAAENSARLIRRTADGKTVEEPLHLREVEQGRRPDMQLQNDDIVVVPFSMVRNIAMGASSIAASASSAIIYAAY